jgi:glycosyltransferase involved in cell wall biosynthesis
MQAMRAPHIALVHDNFTGPTGMGRMAERMAHWLLDAGWQVTVVGSHVPRSLAERCSVRPVRAWPRLPAVPSHLAWCTGAARALRDVRADVVHVHSPLLASRADLLTCHFLAAPARARGVVEHRSGLNGALRRIQERVERAIDDRAYRSLPTTVRVAFVSSFLRDEFSRHYGEPRGGWVLPPPAPAWRPVGTDERTRARRRLGVAGNRLVVGYIGGDDPRKGLPAVRKLVGEPDIELLLAGPGSERLDWGSRPGLGFVDPDEFYAACDVLVAPSLFDSAPVAVLQALARGVPVALSPTTGWADAVARHGAGVVWTPNANGSLAAAAREASMAGPEACRALTEEFAEERQRGALLDVYSELRGRP